MEITKKSKIPIEIRKFQLGDEKDLFDISDRSISDFEFKSRLNRLWLLKNKMIECFVAIEGKNNICHIHWLFNSSHNEMLTKYFKGGFPKLNRNMYLFEGGYTPPNFRGYSIMPYAMYQIVKSNLKNGHVIGFVDSDNLSSSKAMIKAKYKIYLKRIEKWKFLKRKVLFEKVSAEESDFLIKKIMKN